MNRTYFEPKPLNQDDQLNLLNKDQNMTDTDTDLDDDIELGRRLNRINDSSHQSLMERSSTELITDIDTTVYNSCHEWIKATAWRIKQSTQFFLVYMILIVLNAFVLIWEVSDGADRKICIILEGLITLMFMGEVCVQIITETWDKYWNSWLNRIDLIVCILCVLLYIIFASVKDAPHSHYSIGNYMDAIIVGIRYGMQAIRLIRFAQRGNENRRMLNQTQVKFDNKATLSVLSQHGIGTAKHRKQKLSALQKLTNKLFNPQFSVLIRGNSNELRNLKDSIDSMNGNDKSVENEIEMRELNAIEIKNEIDSGPSEDIGMIGFDDVDMPNCEILNEDMIHMSEDKKIANNDQLQNEMYCSTDDGNQLGFMSMYDSEQMAVYNEISNERIAYESVEITDIGNEQSQMHALNGII